VTPAGYDLYHISAKNTIEKKKQSIDSIDVIASKIRSNPKMGDRPECIAFTKTSVTSTQLLLT